MGSILVQDYIRVGGSSFSTVPSVPQGYQDWIDVGDAADATFWIDCREVTGTVNLNLESAPSKDEASFLPVTPPIALAASAKPIEVRTVLGASTVPLSRWVRWRLSATAGSPWDATFRIGMKTSPFGYFSPTQLSSCVLWLRADLGVTFNGSNVSAWNDQSSAANNFTQGTGANQPGFSSTGVGGRPALTFASASSQYMSSASSNVYAQPNTLFLVMLVSSIATESILDGASTNRQQVIIPNAANTVQINAGSAVSVTTSSTTVASIIEVDWNGASSTLWQNGTQQGGAVSPGANSWKPGFLGANQTPGSYFSGSVAELIVLNKLPSATDRTRITRYLGGRYGIAVP